MSRYKPKPGPAAPFAIVLAKHDGAKGSRAEVVATAAPGTALTEIEAVKQSRPNLASCAFVVDQIDREGR